MSSTQTGHGPHLLAAYRALIRALDEIERVAVNGRSPGTNAQPLTPLPPELWAQIQPRLAAIRTEAETIVRRHAPDALPSGNGPQPLAATLRWANLLLRRLEENIEELEPAGITKRFGPFSDPTESERMAGEARQMQEALAEAQQLLDSWRQSQN